MEGGELAPVKKLEDKGVQTDDIPFIQEHKDTPRTSPHSRRGKNEEEMEISKADKEKVCEELQYQQEEELINSIKIDSIAEERIYRPRKSHNLSNKEIYDIIFNCENNEEKRVPVLTINGKLAHNPNQTINCIIDTGCNLSLINSSLLNGVQLDTNKTPKVKSATDTPIKILGSKELLLEIDNIILRERFYVTEDINNELILGNSFLLKNKVKLNFDKKEISLDLGDFKHKIKMHKKWYLNIEKLNQQFSTTVNQITDIKLTEDLIIAPHQHRRIPLNKEFKKNINFEADKSFKEKKKCFPCLIEDENNGQIFINIYNASKVHKNLNKNTIIGFVTENTETALENNVDTKPPIKKLDPNKERLTDKDGVEFDICPELSVTQHKQVVSLLKQYKHLFTTKIEDLQAAKIPPVRVETIPQARPVSSAPYKLGKLERDQLNEILDQLLAADILEDFGDSYTEYSSPVFLVKQANKQPRMVVDMRKVNTVLRSTVSASPSVNLVLSCLNQANSYTKLDLKNAYHQLLVREEDRHLLTIKTQDKLLRFKRLPMGMKTSAQIFSRTLLALLNKVLYSACVAYLDDIVTFGTSFQNDLQNLKSVLEILDKVNLRLNTAKCQFLYKKIDILGFTISQEGILPQRKNVKAILEFPRPNCVRRVRQFIGSSSFFRRHIKGFSTIASPLTDLIKDSNKNLPFKWDEKCEQAFNKIKEALTNPPVLAHWNDDYETFIYVDSSQIGLGGALLQKNPETNRLHPIAYISKKYTPTQQRYSNVEREFLALTYTLNHFRENTMNRKVTVYTDCNSLLHYQNFKNISSRLNRLAISLVDFDLLSVKYIRGCSNLLADGLSRNPVPELIDEDLLQLSLKIEEIKTEDMAQLQAKDEFLRGIRLALEGSELIDSKIRRMSRQYTIHNDLIYYKKFNGHENKLLLAVPKSKVEEILQTYHDNIYSGGHFSYFKTYRKISEKFHWPQLKQDVFKYTRTCDSCQHKRTPTYKQYGTLQPIKPSIVPFQKISIDFCGPMSPSNGYKYILIVTDSCTRMAFTILCRSCNTKTVAKKLLELFCIYGYPQIIVHDRGTHFMGQVVKQLLQSLNITQDAAPPYAHWIISSERFNLILYKLLSHYVEDDPKNWASKVKFATFAYNTSVNKSTNYTPFKLFFGREANLPADYIYLSPNQDIDIVKELNLINQIRKQIPQLLEKSQARQKHYFDLKRRPLNLKPGDEVLVKLPQSVGNKFPKLTDKYKGPFTVKKRLTPVTYLVTVLNNGKLIDSKIHSNNMKPYYRR